MYPVNPNQFDADGDSTVIIYQANQKNFKLTHEIKTINDCNSLVAIFSALEGYKFAIGAVGIDVDDEYAHSTQVKIMKEMKS